MRFGSVQFAARGRARTQRLRNESFADTFRISVSYTTNYLRGWSTLAACNGR